MPSRQTQRITLVGLSLALFAMSGSCTTYDRQLICTASEACVRNGVMGSCVEPGHCAFDDGNCDSGLRWDSTASETFADLCVEAEDVEERNVCGGLSILSEAPDQPCGLCDTGTTECDGLEAIKCMGEVGLEMPITAQGSVSASSEFGGSNYVAIKAVDLDESTSWFSSGPEATPTEYTWVGTANDCISHIKVLGNGGHATTEFQTNYGFGEATVQVLTESDEVVFSQLVDLAGTPDPTIDLDPNVVGRKIKLLFSGHESDDCGGFSELSVTATR